ncbi:hypothetical protein CLOHYLEM_04086 [[Clostridium] hylemonae DSM 15053]|uniref:Uncharacterized protein n=1 Tax=[Clostridium] hylemonae DSM 15053 TaxID=553973 RepID=C0BW99_9FIRM|nr:hypothetical protein CLOHYLEM_04086 [[Clostridium] hylemonae DSM 15053]
MNNHTEDNSSIFPSQDLPARESNHTKKLNNNKGILSIVSAFQFFYLHVCSTGTVRQIQGV